MILMPLKIVTFFIFIVQSSYAVDLWRCALCNHPILNENPHRDTRPIWDHFHKKHQQLIEQVGRKKNFILTYVETVSVDDFWRLLRDYQLSFFEEEQQPRAKRARGNFKCEAHGRYNLCEKEFKKHQELYHSNGNGYFLKSDYRKKLNGAASTDNENETEID